jgi:hypothetical protein
MSRLFVLTCALACACVSDGLRADSRAEDCEREVKERIRNQHEGASDIEFESGRRDDDVRTGFGRWRASNGERILFRYECRLAGPNDRVSAASFDIVRNGVVRDGGWNRGVFERRDVAEMERECRSAVRERLRREHPNASDLELDDDSREWRESNRKLGMRGRGELTGGGGRERDVTWQCEYDVGSGRVTDIDVSVE